MLVFSSQYYFFLFYFPDHIFSSYFCRRYYCKMDNVFTNIRLTNHLLAKSKFSLPHQAVAWMGAMQAQDFNMAKWAVGVRIPGCTEKMTADAFNKGEILRTHVLRPTWHFVAPEDIRWMLQLTAPRIVSSMKSRDAELGVTGEFISKGFQVIEEALRDNNHLTRDELVEKLQIDGIAVSSSQMYHLMFHAELSGLVCSGAMQGKEQTYALLEERVPETKTLIRHEALAKLAKIYFTGHAPATLQDFVWWSGLSVADARHGLEAVKTNFVSEKYDERIYWMPSDTENISAENEKIYLLPAFDEYIVAYRNRSAVLPDENHQRAVSSNGVFRPVIIGNGRVIGLWKKAVSKNKTIITDFFEPVEQTTQELTNEAEIRFKQFLNQ